jgi:aminomethyltransferase
VGKSALTALSTKEQDKVLVGLTGEGKRAARAEYKIYSGETEIGEITSGALSPTLGYPVAMGYVSKSNSELGTEVSVDIRGTRLPMTVVKLPFYKRK